MPVSKLTEGISLLKAPCSALADQVMRGQVAFWIGSGISLLKFPDVPTLVSRVLDLLHGSIDAANPDCPFKRALSDILALTPIDDLHAGVDPATWNPGRKKELIRLLSDRYADVLEQNVRLGGQGRG